MYLAFALCILFAVSVVGGRKVKAAVDRRRRLKLPGYSLEAPLVVDSYDAVDLFRSDARCPACGKGRLHTLGEGTTAGPSGVLTCVRTECLRCEERVALYVDVSGVPS